MTAGRVLLIGYGNPGRQDDGLGPRLAERIAAAGLPGVDVDSDYQLTVEDAHAAAACTAVVFADAAVNGPEPFSLQPVAGDATPGFTSHGVEPAEVVGLARQLFGSGVQGYALAIRGYAFDTFEEKLTERAAANLDAAAAFITSRLRARDFTPWAPTGKEPVPA